MPHLANGGLLSLAPRSVLGSGAGRVAWQELWHFYVSELGLACHLRLALDDDRADVAANAATAVAALVGEGASRGGGGGGAGRSEAAWAWACPGARTRTNCIGWRPWQAGAADRCTP